jgi:hypothetical protein
MPAGQPDLSNSAAFRLDLTKSPADDLLSPISGQARSSPRRGCAMRLKLVRALALSSSLAALSLLGASSPASAYGSIDQWQIGFAGTFVSQTGGASGFWGWCAFGGSNGSSDVGTTGTDGDCHSENYFFTTSLGQALNPFQFTEDIKGWIIGTGSPLVPPGVPSFFVTAGTAGSPSTFEVTGPGAKILHALFGVPVAVPFPASMVCDFSNVPASLVGSPCDTGIPAVPGHFGFTGPGFEIQIQVTKLP